MHATDLSIFCGYEMLLPFQRMTMPTYRLYQSIYMLYRGTHARDTLALLPDPEALTLILRFYARHRTVQVLWLRDVVAVPAVDHVHIPPIPVHLLAVLRRWAPEPAILPDPARPARGACVTLVALVIRVVHPAVVKTRSTWSSHVHIPP